MELGTPARRPGSVRRTTTHDSLRPNGPKGDVSLVAAGRDLLTGADGSATVLDAARLQAQVAYAQGRRITSLETDPLRPALAALVGSGTASGYRAAIDAALPGERAAGSVLYQLLDDVPNALLVSSIGLAITVPPEERLALRQASGRVPLAGLTDVCAGWASGGSLLQGIAETGVPPLPPDRPALDLSVPDDPLAWHATEPLPPTGVRRRRRMDAWRDGDEFAVEAYFRDSYVTSEGAEHVLHEYTVDAGVEPTTLHFTRVAASAGGLPYDECPAATASAGRLAGQPVASLRTWVHREMTGTTTCTHLNDTLRALEDLPTLLAHLPR